MSQSDNGQPAAPKPTIAELEAQIIKSRLDVTGTVDELVERVDPRAHIAEAKAKFTDRAQAFKDGVLSGDLKSIGILAAGVATVAVVIAVSIRRR